MSTIIGLTVMVALFAVGGVVLRRARRQQKPASWPGIMASALAGLVILFLLWMATMVLVVGPAMRTI